MEHHIMVLKFRKNLIMKIKQKLLKISLLLQKEKILEIVIIIIKENIQINVFIIVVFVVYFYLKVTLMDKNKFTENKKIKNF